MSEISGRWLNHSLSFSPWDPPAGEFTEEHAFRRWHSWRWSLGSGPAGLYFSSPAPPASPASWPPRGEQVSTAVNPRTPGATQRTQDQPELEQYLISEDQINNNNKSFSPFFSFYLILLVCMACLGISGFPLSGRVAGDVPLCRICCSAGLLVIGYLTLRCEFHPFMTSLTVLSSGTDGHFSSSLQVTLNTSLWWIGFSGHTSILTS